MSRFRCRRDHCDNLTTVYGGLCAFHLSPIDEDLHAKDDRIADWMQPFDDDIAAMSATEQYIHPENS